jgi:hypothetical protein
MSTNPVGNPQGNLPPNLNQPGGNPPPQYQAPPPGGVPPQQPPYWPPPTWQAPPRPPRHERRGGDFVFPLILIALGILFLLGQMNLIQVNWSLIWPVLLIAIGVGIIFSRRSTPGWLIALLVILLVVFVGFLVVPAIAPGLSISLGETRTITDQVSQSQLDTARTLALNVSEPAGSVTIRPDSSLGNQAVKIVTTSNIKSLDPVTTGLFGDAYRVDVSYRASGTSWLPFLSPFNWGSVRLDRDIALNTILPLQIDAQMTSGNIKADTTNIPIKGANFTFTSGELSWDGGTKVSSSNPYLLFHFTSGRAEARNLGYTNFRQMSVEFTSGEGTFNLAGLTPGSHSLRVGITSGDIRIQVPRGVAYSVGVDRTSGNVVVDGQSLSNGQRLQSPDYGSAATKLDIQLGLTSGDINVDFVSF